MTDKKVADSLATESKAAMCPKCKKYRLAFLSGRDIWHCTGMSCDFEMTVPEFADKLNRLASTPAQAQAENKHGIEPAPEQPIVCSDCKFERLPFHGTKWTKCAKHAALTQPQAPLSELVSRITPENLHTGQPQAVATQQKPIFDQDDNHIVGWEAVAPEPPRKLPFLTERMLFSEKGEPVGYGLIVDRDKVAAAVAPPEGREKIDKQFEGMKTDEVYRTEALKLAGEKPFLRFERDPNNGAGLHAVFLGDRALHHFRAEINPVQYLADVQRNLDEYVRLAAHNGDSK